MNKQGHWVPHVVAAHAASDGALVLRICETHNCICSSYPLFQHRKEEITFVVHLRKVHRYSICLLDNSS